MLILLVSILIALIIVIFAVQNALVVSVQFLFWSAQLPLVLVIFCSVFAGALLMFFLALWRDLKSQVRKKPNMEVKDTKREKPENSPSENVGIPQNPENALVADEKNSTGEEKHE